MSSATWLILKWVVFKIMIPFLGTPNDRCGIILGTQKGAIIFTTTQLELWGFAGVVGAKVLEFSDPSSLEA